MPTSTRHYMPTGEPHPKTQEVPETCLPDIISQAKPQSCSLHVSGMYHTEMSSQCWGIKEQAWAGFDSQRQVTYYISTPQQRKITRTERLRVQRRQHSYILRMTLVGANTHLLLLLVAALAAFSLLQKAEGSSYDTQCSIQQKRVLNNLDRCKQASFKSCSDVLAAASVKLRGAGATGAGHSHPENNEPVPVANITNSTVLLNSAANATNQSKSGLYTIFRHGPFNPVYTYCDLDTDGGGWTVIMRQTFNDTSFERGWKDYEHGFGSLQGSFWLGLKEMQALTQSGNWSLRIDMERENGTRHHLAFETFKLQGENYTLVLGPLYSKDIDDNIGIFDGSSFSTLDRPSENTTSCPRDFKAGWWFYQKNGDCIKSVGNVLTTQVLTLRTWFVEDENTFVHMRNYEMKVRRAN